MSKKTNPTIVGFFVVCGLLLIVGAVIAFSSIQLFSRPAKFILFFDESVKGLDVGAPVTFRGVTVGSVSEVLLHFNQKPADHCIPVIIQVKQDVLRRKDDTSSHFTDPKAFEGHIRNGLRASLKAESMVTGVLFIELFYDPSAPQLPPHQEKPIYREIPTVPTQVDTLLNNLASVDIKGLTEKIGSLAQSLSTTISELKLQELSGRMSRVLASLDQLISSTQFTNTLASVQSTMEEFRGLSLRMRDRIDPIADEGTATLKAAQATLEELRLGVQDLRGFIGPDATLRQNLADSLDQIADAARSISALADYLERNPNALLKGRKPPKDAP